MILDLAKQMNLTFNRTFKELKPVLSGSFTMESQTFNRTFKELKQDQYGKLANGDDTFNRTFKELKRKNTLNASLESRYF